MALSAKELQLGDWVHSSFFGNTRITSLKEFEGYGWIMTTGEENWKSDASLTPIPLTPEILEKNGFKLTRNGGFYKLIDSNFDWSVEVSNNDNRIGFVNRDGNVVKKFYYVHQLQHALRLCGLWELADNFKVE